MRQLPAFALLCSLLISGAAEAALLKVEPGSQEIEKVKIAAAAEAKVEDRAYSLKVVGAGLRYKKVALFKANVYVAELMMHSPEKFSRTEAGALDSLDIQKAVAIRLTFLRDVEGEKVSSGFKEGLDVNKVSLDSPNVKAFLDAVSAGGESKKGSTLVVLGEKLAGGKEAVSWENASGKLITITGNAGFVRSIFSIWLGKIDDSGLENLRSEFLGIKK